MEYELGDVNTDGTISISDLLLMSRYLHGTADITKALFKLADMNGDKKADVFDFVLLR